MDYKSLDELVRDITSVNFMAKSEVKQRILDLLNEQHQQHKAEMNILIDEIKDHEIITDPERDITWTGDKFKKLLRKKYLKK